VSFVERRLARHESIATQPGPALAVGPLGSVTAAPYLSGDRRYYMLQLLRTKEATKEKKEAVEEFLGL
jgi:hypothetical protein